MAFKSSILKDLDWRGLIFQTTHDELDGLLDTQPVTLYCGFDPSADSLHVGNLCGIFVLANFRRHGHNPVGLVGGATGLIGDPSGKSEERNLLTSEQIELNLAGIGGQLRSILDRSLEMHPETLPGPVDAQPIPLVNNADWMTPWSVIDFLRDVGKHFRVGAMLGKDSVKTRLEEREQGLSYTEFSYMLIQGYDFLHLLREMNCQLQVGGSDQWGNITAGTDLIRRVENKPAFGLTFPLVTSSTGQKLGKTEKGATWLAGERTSPYEFYQYWVNRDDADVIDLFKKFTFMPNKDIAEQAGIIERGENRGDVQRLLAHEVTWLVHGKAEADKAVRASKMLFGETISDLSDRELESIFSAVPSTNITNAELQSGIPAIDLFVTAGLVKSKGEGRRLLEQGGVYVNNLRIDALDHVVGPQDLASETKLVLRAGKKKYVVVSVS
jgi:tyrosyl-tRNA synthetase